MSFRQSKLYAYAGKEANIWVTLICMSLDCGRK